MTTRQIEAKAARAHVPYEVAKQIRALLDAAKAQGKYTSDEWADVEAQIIELVTEEG